MIHSHGHLKSILGELSLHIETAGVVDKDVDFLFSPTDFRGGGSH